MYYTIKLTTNPVTKGNSFFNQSTHVSYSRIQLQQLSNLLIAISIGPLINPHIVCDVTRLVTTWVLFFHFVYKIKQAVF